MPGIDAPSFDELHDSSIRIQRCVDLPELLDTVKAELKSLLGAEHVLVYLYDRKWKDLHGRRSPEEDEIRFPVGQGIAGLAVERGALVHVPNASADEAYVAEIDSPLEGEAGAASPGPPPGPTSQAALAVPMFDTSGECLGVLEVLGSHEGGFDEAQQAAADIVAQHVGIALVRAQRRESEKQYLLDVAGAFAGAVDRMRLSTLDHTYRVREYCKRLAKAAELDPASTYALETAAVLHDVGRVELEVREQPDGTLDLPALEMMKPHVLFVEALLRSVRFPEWLAEVPEIISCHHEFLDGSGYPRGRSGAEIPKLARMLVVADSYDACLYGRRVRHVDMRGGRAPEDEAIEYLKKGAGTLFDASIVRLFVEHRCHAIEQRRFPRIEYEAPLDVVVLDHEGEETSRFATQALDISEGGVLFRASEPIPPHTLVRLVVGLPSEKVEAIAKVARVLPDSSSSGGGKRIAAYFLWYGSERAASGAVSETGGETPGSADNVADPTAPGSREARGSSPWPG